MFAMGRAIRSKRTLLVATTFGCAAALFWGSGARSFASSATSSSTASLGVTWMQGSAAPGTPAKYDKVGVIKIGPSGAKNVLVLEPGTSAAAAYFVPLAKWIVSKTRGWQVWSVERRENLLEDQSELNLFKEHKATATQLFDYYLGYIKDSSITHHYQPVADSTVQFAKQWGMNVAVQDLHRVIGAAKKLGGKVVLGGHSLGASVVTAYATWDFDGHAGADDLAGLIYVDGGSTTTQMSARQRHRHSRRSRPRSASPWLAFGGIAAPYAGLFEATGAASALLDSDAPSLGRLRDSCPQTSFLRSASPTWASTGTRQRVDFAVKFACCPGTPWPGHRFTRPDSRLGRDWRPHADRPLRDHVFGCRDP